eukprot:COSAG06_NODE_2627_length_6557_cov_3.762930_2_plen_75_part_00
MPLLIEALLLDSAHLRQDQADAVKAGSEYIDLRVIHAFYLLCANQPLILILIRILDLQAQYSCHELTVCLHYRV